MNKLVLVTALLSSPGLLHAADSPKPVKVFIVAGQSNMEGQAVLDLDGKDYNDGKGTLNALLKDPAKAKLARRLQNDKGEWATLRKAQAAAAARPEFKGNMLFVETHNFVRPAAESPNPGHGRHEFGNAETCILVGDALGQGMIRLLSPPSNDDADPAKPTLYTDRKLEGWTVRVDDRLLHAPDDVVGTRALRFLEAKLADINAVVPEDKLEKLHAVVIVLDLTHGNLDTMQYHPDAGWLKAHGYSQELAKCVHIPRAADLPTKRNINEQPWVILHELAHAYHDQVLGFDDPRILEAYEQYKKSGHGEKTLLFDGSRVRHYALTDHKEFFAEMTEAYFGVNDFFPFNRAELKESEPEIYNLMVRVWETPPRKP